jgi:2-(1,2-epoxy-1,2-dihydrophenyl)acetyl-CoA isomerase
VDAENQPRVLTEWHDGVLIATLNRPERANALDGGSLKALLELFSKTALDQCCSAVVLTGAGQHFCAGADVKSYLNEPAAMSLREGFHPVVAAMMLLDKPIIAAANGAVAGGGLGLFLAADVRIMSHTAQLLPSWIKLGLVPDLGASWLLPRMMGARAYDWLISGQAMSAQRALELGLANEAVTSETVLARSLARGREIASKPALAVALTKRLIRESWTRNYASHLDAEAAMQDLAAARLTEPPKTN